MKKVVVFMLFLGLAYSVTTTNIKRAKAPKLQMSKTSLGLYVSAKEAAKYLKSNKSAIFIDVRSPSELKFTGAASRIDFHIPYKVLDISKYNVKQGSYSMKINKYAVLEILYELGERNIQKDDPIFVTCRSGSVRAAPVINQLASKGYTNVWSISDGYQGTKAKTGAYKARRIVNGWLHTKEKWSWKVDEKKLWFTCKYKHLFDKTDLSKCQTL